MKKKLFRHSPKHLASLTVAMS